MKSPVLKPLVKAVVSATLLGSLISLSGCFPIFLGGAATGAMLATDRRTSATVLEDNTIQLKVSSRISENLGDRVHIDATGYNRQVLLTGEVPTLQDKQLAEKLAADVDNVRSVINELGVMGNSTLSQRSSDLLVGTRVRARLIDAKDIVANAFKVVTERGVVYVFGRVTAAEAKRATDIIRSVDGVQRMVILWEVISDEELARMLPSQPASDPKIR